jgi:hypothetical protein
MISQMILAQRKGGLGRGYETGGPMKVMERDGRKWGRKLLGVLDEHFNCLGTETTQRLCLDEVVTAFGHNGIHRVNERVIGDWLDLINQRRDKCA